MGLEELAETARELNRWEFLCVASPHGVPNGAGSAVNPLAVFQELAPQSAAKRSAAAHGAVGMGPNAEPARRIRALAGRGTRLRRGTRRAGAAAAQDPTCGSGPGLAGRDLESWT